MMTYLKSGLTLFLVLIILLILPLVSAESCTCGCTTWGGGTDKNLASSCIPGYLPPSFVGSSTLTSFIYGYDPQASWFVRECRQVFSSCSTYAGCCGGKCFDLYTEKCCSDFYIPYGYTSPKSSPDNSGLICGKYQYCVDTNNDSKSDTCMDSLPAPPVPKCPSAEELGACKTCDSSTGEVLNIRAGRSSGSCSGQDSQNQCNEFFCDGNGGCISNYSSRLCAPMISAKLSAKVGDLIVEDYSNLKAQLDEINYSQIFPPKLACNAKVGNLNFNGNFIPSSENANLKFDFLISNSEEPIYSTNSDCKGECSVDLPEDYAKLKIKPSETVWCRVTRDSESQESNSLIMPDFYLYINEIKAFNVLEDFPLVAGKPFGISVYAGFRSDTITNMDIDVPVRLKYASAGKPDAQISFKPMKEFNLDEVKNRIKQNPDNPDEKDLQILEKVKKAEDRANFFQLPAPSEGTISVSAEINPQSAVAESSGYDDNSKTESFSVVSTRKLRILPVNVIIRDYDKTYFTVNKVVKRVGYVIREYSISVNQKNSEYLAKEAVSRGMDSVETLYPIAKSNVEILPPVTVVRSRYTDSSMGVYTLSDSRFISDVDIINPIYSLLNSEAKRYGADYALGIVPGRLMAAEGGSNKGVADINSGRVALFAGPICPENKSMCPSNELALLGISYDTFAHELAHLNGISAGSVFHDYSDSEAGIGASKGWVIDQTSGQGKIPRMNIWANPGETVYTGGLLWDRFTSGENIYSKTEIRGPSIFLNLDLLMTIGQANMFVYKDQYQKLLDNYKGTGFKYPSITGRVVGPLPPVSPPAPITNPTPIKPITPISPPISVPKPVVNSPISRIAPPAPSLIVVKNASTILINPPAPVARPVK